MNHNPQTISDFVKIVEVSPRDGLQNEKKIVPTHVKIELINRLTDTGLTSIEATSFVSPKWIPQLKDHKEVYLGINKKPSISYPVLIFNRQGLENALQAGVKEISIFSTPSEEFCKRNSNCTVAENLAKLAGLISLAEQHTIPVRGYISCVLGCPFKGKVPISAVIDMAVKLLDLGCYEISLGDTIGVGTPGATKNLLQNICEYVPSQKLAVHFHDTYGQALANIYVALENNIRVIDSSVAGLGGCPYATGATGNVATEDVLYMLNGLGLKTGVDLYKLVEVGRFISQFLERKVLSKVSNALL